MSQLDILKLNKAIILCDAIGAGVFIDRVFPLLGNVCVVSSDKKFPNNTELNQLIFEKLENDPDLLIVSFNPEAILNLNIASKYIFHMNDLIMESSLVWRSAEKSKIEWNEFRIANVISTIFAQWERKTVRNLSHNYAHDLKYDRDKVSWVLDLVIDHRSTEKT